MSNSLAVILHGGAGKYWPDTAPLKLPALKAALDAAWQVLCAGKPGEEAVVAALQVMEEVPYFNAGFGGYPNCNGVVLLDVGLMRGDRKFISLMNVRRLKYPSRIAYDIFKRHSSLLSIWTHELMQQADAFSEEEKKYYGWVSTNDEMIAPFVKDILKRKAAEVAREEKHGTVGCVVRDADGRLCSGTSTGGIAFKANGRVGDSPIVAGGVYADNEVGALSTTGHGEAFMSSMVSGYVLAEMRRRQQEDPMVFNKDSTMLTKLLEKEFIEFDRKSPGMNGALITIPAKGPPAYTFNSEMVSLGIRTGSKEQIENEDVVIVRKNGERIVTGSGA